VAVAFIALAGLQLRGLVLISERIVKEDVFTSIHIEEFESSRGTPKAAEGRDHARHPERR